MHKTFVLTFSLSLLACAVAFVPTGAAHNCSSWIPSDCGPCTSGDHSHTYCSSNDPNVCATTTFSLDSRAITAVETGVKVGQIIDIVC